MVNLEDLADPHRAQGAGRRVAEAHARAARELALGALARPDRPAGAGEHAPRGRARGHGLRPRAWMLSHLFASSEPRHI